MHLLKKYLMSSAAFAIPGEGGNGAAGDGTESDTAGTAGEINTTNIGEANTGDEGEGGEGAGGAEAGEGGEGAGGAEAGEGGEGVARAAPPPQSWERRELDRKHAQNNALRRDLDEANRRLQEQQDIISRLSNKGDDTNTNTNGNSTGSIGTAAPPAAAQSRTQEEIDAAAQRILDEREYNKSANAADAAGRDTYKDKWTTATDNLKTLGGFTLETMQDILATDKPEQVLFKLGNNPDEYHRIMDLPVAKRRAEIVKLGLPEQKSAPKRPSGAPPPTGTIRGRPTGADQLRDDLTDEQWYALRAKQKQARSGKNLTRA